MNDKVDFKNGLQVSKCDHCNQPIMWYVGETIYANCHGEEFGLVTGQPYKIIGIILGDCVDVEDKDGKRMGSEAEGFGYSTDYFSKHPTFPLG